MYISIINLETLVTGSSRSSQKKQPLQEYKFNNYPGYPDQDKEIYLSTIISWIMRVLGVGVDWEKILSELFTFRLVKFVVIADATTAGVAPGCTGT
jgi:hypothetical protein